MSAFMFTAFCPDDVPLQEKGCNGFHPSQTSDEAFHQPSSREGLQHLVKTGRKNIIQGKKFRTKSFPLHCF